mmetsp:Transcript_21014/g.29662  ORF Transcript_21014/g.29662 Transcript_21014/m.29662 type:complete len:245 (+) Transcript_21014:512-1246(+)
MLHREEHVVPEHVDGNPTDPDLLHTNGPGVELFCCQDLIIDPLRIADPPFRLQASLHLHNHVPKSGSALVVFAVGSGVSVLVLVVVVYHPDLHIIVAQSHLNIEYIEGKGCPVCRHILVVHDMCRAEDMRRLSQNLQEQAAPQAHRKDADLRNLQVLQRSANDRRTILYPAMLTASQRWCINDDDVVLVLVKVHGRLDQLRPVSFHIPDVSDHQQALLHLKPLREVQVVGSDTSRMTQRSDRDL